MSDAELRSLERRFRGSGSPEDEAAWLRARLQAGRLPPDRLEIAVLVGHRPALAIAADTAPPVESTLELLRALDRTDPNTILRAQAAFLQQRLERLPAELPEAYGEAFRKQAAFLDTCILSPESAKRPLSPLLGLVVHEDVEPFIHELRPFSDAASLLTPNPELLEHLSLRALSLGLARLAIGPELAAWALEIHDPVARRCAACT